MDGISWVGVGCPCKGFGVESLSRIIGAVVGDWSIEGDVVLILTVTA